MHIGYIDHVRRKHVTCDQWANMPQLLQAEVDQICRRKTIRMETETQNGFNGKFGEMEKIRKMGKMKSIENYLRVSHSLYFIVTHCLCHCLLLPSSVSVCVCLRLIACA